MGFTIDTFTIEIKKEKRSILRTRGGFTGYNPKYYVIVGKKTRRPSSYEYKKIYKKLRERKEEEEQNKKQG